VELFMPDWLLRLNTRGVCSAGVLRPGRDIGPGLAATMSGARLWRQAQCQSMEHNCGVGLTDDRQEHRP